MTLLEGVDVLTVSVFISLIESSVGFLVCKWKMQHLCLEQAGQFVCWVNLHMTHNGLAVGSQHITSSFDAMCRCFCLLRLQHAGDSNNVSYDLRWDLLSGHWWPWLRALGAINKGVRLCARDPFQTHRSQTVATVWWPSGLARSVTSFQDSSRDWPQAGLVECGYQACLIFICLLCMWSAV